MNLSISVIIPTLNEAAELPSTLAHLRKIPEVREIIIADGGSTDGTPQIAESLGCRVIVAPRGRGTQMHHGAQLATGEVVLLLHADTWLVPTAGEAIVQALARPGTVAGGCYKVFRDPAWIMRGSRFRCWLRFHLRRRFMGDQAIFVRRDVLERVGGVPEVSLMEEFELCRRLRKEGRMALANTVVTTSARRFRKRGILKTYVRMWRVMLQYRCGTSTEKLREIYEKQ